MLNGSRVSLFLQHIYNTVCIWIDPSGSGIHCLCAVKSMMWKVVKQFSMHQLSFKKKMEWEWHVKVKSFWKWPLWYSKLSQLLGYLQPMSKCLGLSSLPLPSSFLLVHVQGWWLQHLCPWHPSERVRKKFWVIAFPVPLLNFVGIWKISEWIGWSISLVCSLALSNK